jgi:hypothetical protein
VESVQFGREEYRERNLFHAQPAPTVYDIVITHLTVTENEYVRPLSRAAVTALMTAYATPSVSV